MPSQWLALHSGYDVVFVPTQAPGYTNGRKGSAMDLIGIGKLAEAVAKPTEKLIEEVSKGIGTLYRPLAIRQQGEAEAATLLVVERAKAEAEEVRKNIALNGQLNRIAQLANSDWSLIERAKVRLALQEIQGQINIEAIADEALKQLPDEVSEVPIRDEWRQRFFKLAADVSESEMQELWAKILAGEVAAPQTFSIRTIDTLHKLSQADAAVFKKFASLCAVFPYSGAVPLDGTDYGLSAYGVTFNEYLLLVEAGLVNSSIQMSWPAKTPFISVIFRGCKPIQIIQPSAPVNIQYLPLSQSGLELSKIIAAPVQQEYVAALAAKWQSAGLTVVHIGS